MSGFGTNGGQLNDQPGLLRELSEGMSTFNRALTELGMFDSVTAFTAPEFARTLTSNGDGTGHGWGGHQLIMGGLWHYAGFGYRFG